MNLKVSLIFVWAVPCGMGMKKSMRAAVQEGLVVGLMALASVLGSGCMTIAGAGPRSSGGQSSSACARSWAY